MSAEDVQNKEIALFEYWNDLPNELKLECIKKMTFMERTKLRLASKTEMGLVESIKEKYQFYYVHLNVITYAFRQSDFEFVAKSDEHGTEIVVKRADNAHRLDKFFATSKIEWLRMKFRGADPRVIECLKELVRSDVQIQAETVQVTFCRPHDIAETLIEKCDPASLKKIVVNVLGFYTTSDTFYKVRQVCAVKTLHFKSAYDGDDEMGSSEGRQMENLIRNIMKMWKRKSYPVGKEATIDYGSSAFSFIRDIFASVLIHESDKTFRIPVLNGKKSIWFFNPNQLKYFVMFIAKKPSAKLPFLDFDAIEKRKIEEEKAEREQIERRLQRN